ncbi:Alpha/Beta hydrolase protein [Lasiosphaeris hirsuta]|uniref:Alpha/Beta hydrolase protein n=1 Tax=Lasiosphaeris hirsuta TaxID=260670 RepID=A0AA40B035_9PEZI|nr:Alpha/Beta hydrolase protein [Lasiosphaeris hirsuta]
MAPGPSVPTVAETLSHPAYPTAMWQLEPDRKGFTPVAEGRGGPFKISWEVHGEGPVKVVLIMGLGGLKSVWQRQTLHFGHERRDRYSVLLVDNRGMGDSDKPLMRYSSSEMARDLIEVLTSISWLPADLLTDNDTAPATRSLHIIGLSLGGMIAQELACLIPGHISTLSLCCTAATIENTTTFAENMANRASMLVPKSVDRSIGDTARQIFSPAWLSRPDDVHLPTPGTTPRCHPAGGPSPDYQRFTTNAQRFVAQELHKRRDPASFGLKGFLLQLIAAGWHYKSAAQLAAMADRLGRERILVMHGLEDGMISTPHGRKLIEYIQPGVGLIIEGMGHAPLVERWEWFNRTIEERCALGEKLDGR